MRVVGSACVVGLLIAGSSLRAADPPAVGIVNFDRVVKMHKPFQDKLDALKKEAKDLDDSFKARQAEFETVVNNLKKAAPGSPEFNRLQQQAGKLQGELQQFINTERANLQKKEATLYVGFYKQIDPAIGKVAKAKGLKLVLKDQESTFDENQNVQELLKALNRSILYQEGLDITADIVKELAASPAGKSR
jgi:Skp family chaperone for outer membrane proteins